MNLKYSFVVLVLAVFQQIACDCGCLKCSKHLQVISPPSAPFKVILKGVPSFPEGYRHAYAPQYDYPLNAASVMSQPCQPVFAYKYKLQAPLPPPGKPLAPPMTGLIAKPDRIVIQQTAPSCPVYIDDGACDDAPSTAPPCRSIFEQGIYQQPMPLQAMKLVPYRPRMRPVLEPIGTDFYTAFSDCRYNNRKKRELPIFKNSLEFLLKLLPGFLRFPLEQTFKSFKYHGNKHKPKYQLVSYPVYEPSETPFLQKLLRLNSGRAKRSLILDNDEISLPFLRVTNVENEESEEEEESGEMIDPREEFLRPLNFNHLLPQNPIFYLLNTPIRLLHHFHKFGQQISPVFKSVPHVLINSKRYLRNFGRHLRNDVLNIASNLIGDFDDVESHYTMPKYRFRRDVAEQYEPEYSLVFGNQTKERRKRYILKVVDEDEVEAFLREKLGDFVGTTERPKKKKEKESNKKKLLVERLSSKLIIDNKGRPFIEINGIKRPLFFNKQDEEEQHEDMKDKDKLLERIKRPSLFSKKKNDEKPKKEEKKDESLEDMKDKINSIILQARERVTQTPPTPSIPTQIIKDRINQILSEIQDLITSDFDKYSSIYSNLYKLQNFKDLLVIDWKKILTEEKHNDIPSKIRLLDEFKEMQALRDKSVQDIASILSSGSTFMTKKLIKMLVRLQKLQCVIYRVVEDFGEKIKMGTEFDVRKEIKYVDYLTGLQFVKSGSMSDLGDDLKRERDKALENELTVLDGLRKLSEGKPEARKIQDETQLLWEIRNIDKLQKDTIEEMNEKIGRGLKVRKELKILFDLLRQLEACEEKQKKLIEGLTEKTSNSEEEEESQEFIVQKRAKTSQEFIAHKPKRRRKIVQNTIFNRNRNLPHRTIIEDKKPVKLVSNGYTMTAYKVSDGFD